MGWDYALVHLKYTIPPSIALTLLYHPLLTRLDLYKIAFLVTIAVVSTIPWDSYLIRTGIWTYPPNAVLGPTFFCIPLEELFFFVIQTYAVSLLYLCISKPTFAPAHLDPALSEATPQAFLARHSFQLGMLGNVLLGSALGYGSSLVHRGGTGTYMGLIVIWAFPFLILLWTLSHRFMLRLPAQDVLVPIVIPTLFLWLVDTFALRRGTWVIVEGTKYGVHVWAGLEIEEAFFFLATNCLIVFGLVAFDNAMAILDTFPEIAPSTRYPSPLLAIQALLLTPKEEEAQRIVALQQAIDRLQKKSRSFYLASSAFQGRLRVDLVLLYSFCRAADDLVDTATSKEAAMAWIQRMHGFLYYAYNDNQGRLEEFVKISFPADVHLAFLQLPTSRLTQKPLEELLRGFEVDLRFSDSGSDGPRAWPIENEASLLSYGHNVAGTVAELCLDLVFHHHGQDLSQPKRDKLRLAGDTMGKALQTVNIARDIRVDAEMGRVYIPTSWLKHELRRPEDIIKDPLAPITVKLRARLLDLAFDLYGKASGPMEDLPVEARGPLRVAVESYMEIGRVLRDKGYRVQAGRATVPKLRRLKVAWRALTR